MNNYSSSFYLTDDWFTFIGLFKFIGLDYYYGTFFITTFTFSKLLLQQQYFYSSICLLLFPSTMTRTFKCLSSAHTIYWFQLMMTWVSPWLFFIQNDMQLLTQSEKKIIMTKYEVPTHFHFDMQGGVHSSHNITTHTWRMK